MPATHAHAEPQPSSYRIVALGGVLFLVMAAIELITGVVVGNPAVRANAAHDALDGLTMLSGGAVILMFRRSVRHGLNCLGPKLVSMAVIGLVITGTAIGSLWNHTASTSARSNVAAICLGVVSFTLNYAIHRRLPHSHGAKLGTNARANHDDHAGFKFDLLADMLTAIVVTITGLAAAITGQSWLYVAATVMIAVIVVALGSYLLIGQVRLLHREQSHPGPKIVSR